MRFPFQLMAVNLCDELNCLRFSLSNSIHKLSVYFFPSHLEYTHTDSHPLKHMWCSVPLCLGGVITAIWPPTTAGNTGRIPIWTTSLCAFICRANYKKFCPVVHKICILLCIISFPSPKLWWLESMNFPSPLLRRHYFHFVHTELAN